MAKAENQKFKLLYLIKILSKYTDDQHALTVEEIKGKLLECGISVERKTLYRDLRELGEFGLDIIQEHIGRHVVYHMGSRDFELPELKLLVDLVQSSKFITDKKSRKLIKKLESLTSIYEAMQLQRQVYVSGRIKSENESIYYIVDKLHEAINQDRNVYYQYFRWGINKEKQPRRDGRKYYVSPWALSWSDENYYLIGYDNDQNEIRHYRVDKIMNLELADTKRIGKKEFAEFDMALYTKRRFGMYGGEEKDILIQADEGMIGILLDYLGKDIIIERGKENDFIAKARLVPNKQFLGWLLSLGNEIKIIGPEEVVEEMKELLYERIKLYEMK